MTHLSHRQRVVSLIAAAALVVLTIGGLTWLLFGLDDDDTTVVAETSASTTTTTHTTPTPTTRPSTQAGEYQADEGYTPGLQLPPMGIDSTRVSWDVVELPVPGDGEPYVHSFVHMDDRYVAFGTTWDHEAEQEQTLMWESDDALEWTLIEAPAGISDVGLQVIPTDEGIVGISTQWIEDEPTLRVFLSGDARTWIETDVSGFVDPDQHMWLSRAAGGDGILLLSGQREPFYGYEEYEPAVMHIEKDGMLVEIDPRTRSYLVTEAASGTVITHGSEDLLWESRDDYDDLVIHDPATGEALFRTDWDTHRATAESAFESVVFGNGFNMEWTADGHTLTIDQYTRRLAISDQAGRVLLEGDESLMWQSSPFLIADPDTGDVIMTITWDEWEKAQQPIDQPPEEEWYVETVLLRSADAGHTWEEIEIEAISNQGLYLSDIVHGPAGFMAVGSYEPMYEDMAGAQQVVVLTSTDGLAWASHSLPAAMTGWMHGLVATEDSYLAVLNDDFDARVVTSPDGENWTTVLSQDELALPLGTAWFQNATTGGMGTFVIGSRGGEESYEKERVTMSKQGRTLTMEHSVYMVTDDVTGEVLFEFDEAAHWASVGWEEEPPSNVRWGDGGIAIFDDDGVLIFAVSHAEWEEVQPPWDEPNVWYEPETFLLRDDGTGWISVELPTDLGDYFWFEDVAVEDDRVLMTATLEPTYPTEEYATQVVILIGRD